MAVWRATQGLHSKQSVKVFAIVCTIAGTIMPTPKERLSHLLELAARGAGERAALAGEVADLLLDWPDAYPTSMRATFESLLEKIVREMDLGARAALAPRFHGRDDVPLTLLNEFFLCAPDEMRAAILARNDAAGATDALPIDSGALLEAARSGKDFAAALARRAGLGEGLAAQIAGDGGALAVLCKGAGISRATFSAIAILAGPPRPVDESFAMLAAYDRVPASGAMQLLAFWQAGSEPALEAADAA